MKLFPKAVAISTLLITFVIVLTIQHMITDISLERTLQTDRLGRRNRNRIFPVEAEMQSENILLEEKSCRLGRKLFMPDSNEQSICTHLRILATRIMPDKVRPMTCNNCNSFNFTSLIHPENICGGNGLIELLMLVTTSAKAIRSREATRATWASHSNKNTANVRYLFLFGGGLPESQQAIIQRENIQYGDILQESYKDAYYNLSYKVMSGYQWALKHCPRAQFILRTADDNFVHVPNVLFWIRTFGPENMRAQIGYILEKLEVHRQMTRKWFISYAEFPEDYYPPYAVGTSFLYSMPAVSEVVKAAPNVPFFPIEDAWFGMVMKKINMTTKALDGILEHHTADILQRVWKCKCPFNDTFIAIHPAKPEALNFLWRLCPLSRQTLVAN